MKEIKAFVRPNKVNEIVQHLREAGFENITVSMAEGTGKLQRENASISQKFSITDSEIAKLEIVAEESNVEAICGIICEYGCTINPGDGIIYVSDINKTYRVKSGLENNKNKL